MPVSFRRPQLAEPIHHYPEYACVDDLLRFHRVARPAGLAMMLGVLLETAAHQNDTDIHSHTFAVLFQDFATVRCTEVQ